MTLVEIELPTFYVVLSKLNVNVGWYRIHGVKIIKMHCYCASNVDVFNQTLKLAGDFLEILQEFRVGWVSNIIIDRVMSYLFEVIYTTRLCDNSRL